MSKARNGIRYSESFKQKAFHLRKKGRTHREIAKVLNISTNTAFLWAKGVSVTLEQKSAIEKRRNKRLWSKSQRDELAKRMATSMAAFRTKYTDKDLLNKIIEFHKIHGRIPLKREFNAWDIYKARFGSWNRAIVLAGFEPNPVLFAKKFIARDGHSCDSFTEKVIDDWLFANNIKHRRHVLYDKNIKLTADFELEKKTFMEFFGLAGVQSTYDKMIQRKRKLSKKRNCRLIEIYPADIYPVNKLPVILKEVNITN